MHRLSKKIHFFSFEEKKKRVKNMQFSVYKVGVYCTTCGVVVYSIIITKDESEKWLLDKTHQEAYECAHNLYTDAKWTCILLHCRVVAFPSRCRDVFCSAVMALPTKTNSVHTILFRLYWILTMSFLFPYFARTLSNTWYACDERKTKHSRSVA